MFSSIKSIQIKILFLILWNVLYFLIYWGFQSVLLSNNHIGINNCLKILKSSSFVIVIADYFYLFMRSVIYLFFLQIYSLIKFILFLMSGGSTTETS